MVAGLVFLNVEGLACCL